MHEKGWLKKSETWILFLCTALLRSGTGAGGQEQANCWGYVGYVGPDAQTVKDIDSKTSLSWRETFHYVGEIRHIAS